MRLAGLTTLLAGVVLAHAAWAQSAPPTRIRGTITTVDAHAMGVSTRSGETLQVTLDDPLTVGTVRPVPLEGIVAGGFVGTTARRQADGTLVALEVHVFPEEMRGAGEGHRPWDLEPGSTMTNATVTGAVESANGRELTLTYKDGSQTVQVPPGTPVVTFAPAERADLKPGAPVFFSASPGADGRLHTTRITVGTHGVAPPM